MKKYSGFYLPHLAAAALLTILILLIYISVQQVYRTNADDPQLDWVYRIQERLIAHEPANSILPEAGPDLAHGNQLFAVLYDSSGKASKSSAMLDGTLPQLPAGVFAHAASSGEGRVTWQPRKGVRMAMVIINSTASPYRYIAAGRSLSETENRISNLNSLLILGWAVSLLGIVLTAVLQYRARTFESNSLVSH